MNRTQRHATPPPPPPPPPAPRPRTPAPLPGAGKPAAAAPASLGDELDAVLRQMVAEHETLLALTRDHKAALARADLVGIEAAVGKQNESVQRIAALEQRRQALAATGALRPDERPTVGVLARSLAEPARSRVLALGERLKELLSAVQRENASLRMAAAALSGHMEGLIRQVTGRLSHAGTYARSGAVESRVQVVSALDVRS